MKLTRLAIIPAVTCIMASAGFAQTFSCALEDSRNTGWLPETLVVQVSSDQTMAKAYDPITFSTLNGFAEAEVQAENTVRIELRWVTGRYRNNKAGPSRDNPTTGYSRIEYRATILRGGNKILMRATPEGNQGRFSAKGACQSSNANIDQVVRP